LFPTLPDDNTDYQTSSYHVRPRRDAGNTDRICVLPEHLPDDLFVQAFAAEGERPVFYARRRRLGVDGHLHRAVLA
jgi:sirohydrochlorin ferrochelatase